PTSGDKEDISHLANRMFDQNVNNFTEGETMNRDYLQHIYGESMDFLNKDVRLTRTKHYEMRENIEKSFAEKIQYEKKKLLILSIIFGVIILFAVISFCLSAHSFDVYHEIYRLSFYEYVDKSVARAYWAQGGLFFGIGWISLVTSVTLFGAFLYSAIKNVRQYKKRKDRALRNLEENKREQMLLGLYDAGR
ncbi:MAG: hypothetical protein IKW45_02445, partial [Clostridia bacterium]|nr:hypothetical protein [Clostridia bacterium]